MADNNFIAFLSSRWLLAAFAAGIAHTGSALVFVASIEGWGATFEWEHVSAWLSFLGVASILSACVVFMTKEIADLPLHRTIGEQFDRARRLESEVQQFEGQVRTLQTTHGVMAADLEAKESLLRTRGEAYDEERRGRQNAEMTLSQFTPDIVLRHHATFTGVERELQHYQVVVQNTHPTATIEVTCNESSIHYSRDTSHMGELKGRDKAMIGPRMSQVFKFVGRLPTNPEHTQVFYTIHATMGTGVVKIEGSTELVRMFRAP